MSSVAFCKKLGSVLVFKLLPKSTTKVHDFPVTVLASDDQGIINIDATDHTTLKMIQTK